MRRRYLLALCAALLLATHRADASIQPLQNATATFSQVNFGVSESIDNSFDSSNGWAIDPNEADQTAVYETVADTVASPLTALTFQLHQLFTPPDFHLLGRFRISATTDSRATFADGLQSGGDVTATWTVLTPLTFTSSNGSILAPHSSLDGSILASGPLPPTDVYTITALTNLSGITGFRLEVFEDPTLPFNGPGRQPINGNFVLSEFTVDAVAVAAPTVPEQSAAIVWMALAGTIVGGAVFKRRLVRA